MNDPTTTAAATTKPNSNNRNRRRRKKPNNNNTNDAVVLGKTTAEDSTAAPSAPAGDFAIKRRRKGSTSEAPKTTLSLKNDPPSTPGSNNNNNNKTSATSKNNHHSKNHNHKATTTTTNTASATPTSSQQPLEGGGSAQLLRFADLDISVVLKRAMAEVFHYDSLTPVQAQTLPIIQQGTDCLARAKTGTGKTLAFMIPTVDKLLKSTTSTTSTTDVDGIACLVLSPNRELALQIHAEVVKLTKYCTIRSAVVVGGTSINKDVKVLKNSTSPNILIATPGRLLDHLDNYQLKIPNLQVLIFDEFDQLLDQGFEKDLRQIMAHVEASRAVQRQTLLFSATLPKTLSDMAKEVLHPNHAFVDTVGDNAQDQTHLHVPQRFYQCAWKDQLYHIQALLSEHMTLHPKDYKIIVFFTTARLTGFLAELFNSMSGSTFSVLEIHSRKSQSARTKASDAFRAAKTAVLFSSDVSARGLDYPDVTFVLQVGLTERDQYIHRLGRSGRAGKMGGGALLVADEEAAWMKRTLQDMPLQFCNLNNTTEPQQQQQQQAALVNAMTSALQRVQLNPELKASAEQAYRAWLGFYNSGNLKKVQWDKPQLVQQANAWARLHGLVDNLPPSIPMKTVGKMGLRGVRGINVEK